MSTDNPTYEQALEEVCAALYIFAQVKGRIAKAVLDAKYDHTAVTRAVAEQGAAVEAHNLVNKMLSDFRKAAVA